MEKEHAEKFNNYKPALTIRSNTFTFDEKDTGYVYEFNKMAPPSADELKNAEQYNKDVMYCSNMANPAENCEMAPTVKENKDVSLNVNDNKDCENILVLKDDKNV